MLVGRARLTVVVAASAALLVAGLGMVAVAPGDLTAPVGVATVGAAGVMGDVGVLTLLQRAVPEEVLARVFGAAGGVLIGTVGIGSLLAPALQHALGTREALAVAGVIPAIAITLGWPRLHRAEDPALDVSHRLKLLRRLEPFASLPATTLQELAASLRPLRAVAGESIVRQGEPAHDYFVLAAGACQAAVDGTIATVHHPGEGFGEIALVRDVPRTATVTAIQDSELYALRRSAFLGALARHAGATVAAEGTATARLARLRPRAGEAT
jgi:MFS family permease